MERKKEAGREEGIEEERKKEKGKKKGRMETSGQKGIQQYSGPWNNRGLNCMSPLTQHIFFTTLLYQSTDGSNDM